MSKNKILTVSYELPEDSDSLKGSLVCTAEKEELVQS